MMKVDTSANVWGVWATIGFGIIIAIIFIVGQILCIIGLFEAIDIFKFEINLDLNHLDSNGFILGVTEIIVAPICVGMIILFVKLRKNISLKEYLGLYPVRKNDLIKWLALTMLFILVSDAAALIVGKPVVPQFMISAYETAYIIPLLLIAILVLAPILEELFFRSFILEGLRQSRLGLYGAIVLTSFVWAIIHIQYETFIVSYIFIFGIILGYARFRTGSIYTPIVMHSFTSMIATLQLVIYLHIEGNGFNL